MKRRIIFAMLLCLSSITTWAEQVVIETKNVSMVLEATKGAQPQYVYFGNCRTCRSRRCSDGWTPILPMA